MEPSRLEELRRWVERDPASILFAQLAEEHRRSGEYQEAVRVCRAGLSHHPDYHSARVTLGRSLLALGHLEAAQIELQTVLREGHDNVVARRNLAEVYRRAGRHTQALSEFRLAQALTPRDPELAARVADLEATLSNPAGSSDGREKPDSRLQLVARLEHWLAIIVRDRAERQSF